MSGSGPVAVTPELTYLYDGGLKGFYSCVHASVYSREVPFAIWREGEEQPSLLPYRWIETDAEKAGRVRVAIEKKITPRARELVETVFLSCMQEKELPMLRFLLLGFREGGRCLSMLAHPDVAALAQAERHLLNEAHLLKGFIRFSDVGGALIATIRPKNFVLPFIAEHFMERFSQETFLIYDRTHKAALIYEHHRGQIVPLDAPPEFEVSEEEAQYRALWKQFYHTISIKARENHRCRRTHMPMRYWAEMTEMHELL